MFKDKDKDFVIKRLQTKVNENEALNQSQARANIRFFDRITNSEALVKAQSKKIQIQAQFIQAQKEKIVNMRRECNSRYSNQLQEIRKLNAQLMIQIQDPLFKENE